jgi:hypothetical protein
VRILVNGKYAQYAGFETPEAGGEAQLREWGIMHRTAFAAGFGEQADVSNTFQGNGISQ